MSSAYISTPELIERYEVTDRTIYSWRKDEILPFPSPEIKRHGRSNNLYSRKMVAKWEEATGKAERLSLTPLLESNDS